ncbi:MAG: TonB-dependent receptor [Carboxylicivirga sp.]|jgi:iron complex outermembrane receptor protein|nr:TonB-dependent receptor [Carboxylicivirga sp.]
MFKTKYITLLLFSFLIGGAIWAQEIQTSNLTKDKILSMSTEELSALSLDELMAAINVVGVSSLEELYELLLNKDVTSASKAEESLFDSPLSTTVLSQKEILESGATSIEEALRMVPGVIVREKTNGNYDVQIRGGQNMPMNNMLFYAENTSTLVMVNGRPVFNYAMGGILWESLPVSLGELDRIEVVRGPSSALYGPNAVNGVINLITKDLKKDDPLVSANVQGGTLSTFIGDVNLRKAVNDRLIFGISGSYETRNRKDDEIYAIRSDEYLNLDDYEAKRIQEGWTSINTYDRFDDIDLAKEKKGVNGYVNFTPNKDMNFNISMGYHESGAITSTLGDNPTSYANRLNKGFYSNLQAEIYGFNFQVNTSNAENNFNNGHNGWTMDTYQYNFDLDYLIRAGKVDIRPGVSYQTIYADDRDHIEQIGDGYINRRVNLNSFAASMRLDYKPTDNLRLVAALRSEKYNVPDEWKPSYQFIASYKINENNLIRAVYSKANQSTFLMNAYNDYTWNLGPTSIPNNIKFVSNDNPDMMTMEMYELGYRARIGKRLLIDVEAFYNNSENFSSLLPDQTVSESMIYNPQLSQYPIPVNTTLFVSYQNIDLEAKQYGASLNADLIISEKLVAKAHFNIQKSEVDNFMDYNRDDIARKQIEDNMKKYNPTKTDPYVSTYQIPESEYKNGVKNEAIPSFWTMCELTYKSIEKLSITGQGYYYDNYNIYNQYDSKRKDMQNLKYTGEMDSKFILNAKVNYQVNDKMNVFINGRNILNNDQQEYVFMDKIGGLYLAGINFHF